MTYACDARKRILKVVFQSEPVVRVQKMSSRSLQWQPLKDLFRSHLDIS